MDESLFDTLENTRRHHGDNRHRQSKNFPRNNSQGHERMFHNYFAPLLVYNEKLLVLV